MNKDQRVLDKMRAHLASILKYCENCKSLGDFEADRMRVEACVFNLMQIGELAKTSLSDECKSNIKGIPWNQIYGLRNRIVHGYDGVDLRIVWDTVCEDLPVLYDVLQIYMNE